MLSIILSACGWYRTPEGVSQQILTSGGGTRQFAGQRRAQSSDRGIHSSQHDGIARVDLRTASNEKCGECEPAIRTETEIGKSQREIREAQTRSPGDSSTLTQDSQSF